jgi:hypothetical protein
LEHTKDGAVSFSKFPEQYAMKTIVSRIICTIQEDAREKENISSPYFYLERIEAICRFTVRVFPLTGKYAIKNGQLVMWSGQRGKEEWLFLTGIQV